MAIPRKYVRQMPWVGSEDEFAIMEHYAKAMKTSKAEVTRRAYDAIFGLVAGELPEGVTVEEAVAAGQAAIEALHRQRVAAQP